MSLPKIDIGQMLQAGVHFGHKTSRWNPKMAPYIYGKRNGIHIIDLQKTANMLYNALSAVYKVSRRNGRILFVSTKKQASDIIASAATRCGQYYVNHRWLGGMLTNWKTVSESIKTLDVMERQLEDEEMGLSKKEKLSISRKVDKLEKALGGIRHMKGTPDLLVVLDSGKENIALEEAKLLGIPVIGIVDSNSSPDNINFVVPGNDDATSSIDYFTSIIADASLAGLEKALQEEGAVAEETEEKTA